MTRATVVRFPKGVKRVAILADEGIITVHRARSRRRRKKGRRELRPMSKLMRTLTRAQYVGAKDLFDRFQRDDRRRRDGGLKRWAKNSARATRKAAKIVRNKYF